MKSEKSPEDPCNSPLVTEQSHFRPSSWPNSPSFDETVVDNQFYWNVLRDRDQPSASVGVASELLTRSVVHGEGLSRHCHRVERITAQGKVENKAIQSNRNLMDIKADSPSVTMPSEPLHRALTPLLSLASTVNQGKTFAVPTQLQDHTTWPMRIHQPVNINSRSSNYAHDLSSATSHQYQGYSPQAILAPNPTASMPLNTLDMDTTAAGDIRAYHPAQLFSPSFNELQRAIKSGSVSIVASGTSATSGVAAKKTVTKIRPRIPKQRFKCPVSLYSSPSASAPPYSKPVAC